MRKPLWLQRWLVAALVAMLIGTGLLPRTAAAAPATGAPVPPSAATRQDEYENFVPISDSAGIFQVEVPEEWQDVEETEWSMDDEAVGIKLTATPDLAAFYDSWDVPGLVLSYSESLPETMSEDELLDTIDYSDVCTDGGRETLPEDDGDLSGSYQIWNDCDGKTNALVAVFTPIESPDYYVLMEIYAVTDADKAAFQHIIDTFAVGPASQTDSGTNSGTVAGTQGAVAGPVTSTDSPLFDEVDTSDLTYSYVELRDPSIVALIPEDYSDIAAAEWNSSDGERLGSTLTAAPSIEDFNATWTTPGIIVKSAIDLEEALDADEMLKDESLEKDCTYDDRYTDERTAGDVTYTIDYDWYNNCGDTESSYVVGLAQSDPPDEVIFFDFLIADQADEEAFDVFLQSFSLDRELATASATAAATEDTGTQADTPAAALIDVADDSNTISLRVPESWTDSTTEDWTTEEDGVVGTIFTVAPDVEDFANNWDVPGATISVSDVFADLLAPEDALDDTLYADECTYDDRYDLETDNLVGQYDVWLNCGDVEGSTLVVLAANPTGESSPLILLEVVLPTEDDATLFDELINSLAVAGALESADAAEEEQLLDAPLAIVETASLNIRSGPGTNYNRVGVANQGDALVINGQVDDCDWLQVTTPDGVEGWASGKSQYVTLDTRCVDIPEAERPEPPAAASGSNEQGGARGDSGSNAGAASGSANASKGCYLFQNQLGAELNITFTNRDSGKGTTFKVPASGEKEQCFDPGRYTYTLDAPPPWGSTNGELTVQAGDQFLFPITPE